MSYIVQKAVAINTASGNTATAIFPKPLTSGNRIVIAAAAVDAGASIGGSDTGASSSAGSITDTQSLSFGSGGVPWIFPDNTHNTTLYFGVFCSSVVADGPEIIEFTFAPVSNAANCQVGFVAYEVNGLVNGFFNSNSGSDTAVPGGWPVGSDMGGGFGFGFTAGTYGNLIVEIGVAFTSDGSAINVGSGYFLDGVGNAHIGSTHSTIAAQSAFVDASVSSVVPGSTPSDCFGNSPSSGVGLSSVGLCVPLPLASAFSEPTLSVTTSSLANGQIGSAYSATLAATGGTAAYPWSITGGALPSGVTLDASSGVISGTPTVGGNFNIQVTCTDAYANTATKSLSLDVVAAPGLAGGGWQSYQQVIQQPQRQQPAPPRPFYNPKR